MTPVTDTAATEDAVLEEDVPLVLVGTFVAAAVIGGGLYLAARQSATALLVAVALTQALFALAWVFGTVMPGRKGALVIAVGAAAASDAVTSVWPHGRLEPLLPVLALAVPAMFIHQLLRGAARVQVVASLSATALLVLGEVAPAALLQLRHEFGTTAGGTVTAAVVAAIGAALAIGCLVDILLPAPRFDQSVGRGLLALVASAGLGGSVGYLTLRHEAQFGVRGATFAGGALGALAGLMAIACAFVLATTPRPPSLVGRGLRPVIGAVLPVVALAPAAFLLCLAIRS
jgi:hypothetical protein